MTRVKLLLAICCAAAILAIPQSALAVGPATTPETFFTEGFESAVPVTYETTGATTQGYWGRVIAPKVVNPAHGGVASLWCDGSNPTAVFRYKYADGSQGYATFTLAQTVDYYKPVASLWYSFPSAGYSERGTLLAFAPEWTTPAANGVSNAQSSVSYPTGFNEWKPMSINLASETTDKTSLSRAAGTFRLRWRDQTEPPGHSGDTNGQGASVDDVTIAGWKFGPVQSLSATTTSISSTLTWLRPWRSYAATSTEERPLSYRVWRAPKGSTDWTELTPAVRVSNPATGTVTYSDTTVADGIAYTYAVQAWGPGTGDDLTVGYGEHLSIDATTKPFPVPSVSITSPLPSAVVTGTGSMGIAGTVQAFDGATVSSVMLRIRRSDNNYFDNASSTWGPAQTTYAAAVNGTTWSSAWIPTPSDYKAYTYSISVIATDSRGKIATTQVTSIKADTVPYVAPVTTVTSPAEGSVVATTGTFTVTGSATVQTGLPAATVQVGLAHGSTWWNGSVWTTAETWVPATVNGSVWTLSDVTPPANEYGVPTYVATARATDAHVLTSTLATRTFRVDSVPFVAPTVGLAFPENNVDVIGIGPYTLRGTVASVHPNLPLAADSVRVFIKRDTAGLIRWWNGSAWVASETSVLASGTANWTYIWQPPVNEFFGSTFTVYATALDAHGLMGTSANAVFQVNSVAPNPPDILFTTPSGALTSQVGTLAVAGTTAGRDGASVQRVSLHIGRSSGTTGTPTTWWDGSTWTASETSATYIDTTYSAGASTWSYDWKMPTDEYAAHTYVLRAYAYDEFSRIGTSTPESTQLDTVPWTAPTVNMMTPPSGPDLVGTGSHAITGTVTPVHANLPLTANSVRVKIARDTAGDVTWWDGSAWVSVETSVAAVGTSAWSYNWTPPASEYHKSSYVIHATALDAHGVTGSSAGASFMVDSVPYVAPVATIASPSANATLTTTGAISVIGSATVQTGLPVPTVEVRLAHGATWWNGLAWTTTEAWVRATLTGTTWRLNGVQPPAKEYGTPAYVATARATDAHALTGTSATRTFKVDSVPMDPPTTTVYPPTANPAPAAPIRITGDAAVAAAVRDSPITLRSVRVTIEAKSNTGTKSWWNGAGWQSTPTSVAVTGSLSPWSTTFTSKLNDNRVYTYTIMSTATDTHGLSGNSALVTMSADNVGPRIVSARSLGRYAIEVRFTEQPFAPAGAGPIDSRYFSARGLRLRKIIGWSNDGTRVRIMTLAQPATHGSLRVTLRKPVKDALGN